MYRVTNSNESSLTFSPSERWLEDGWTVNHSLSLSDPVCVPAGQGIRVQQYKYTGG